MTWHGQILYLVSDHGFLKKGDVSGFDDTDSNSPPDLLGNEKV